MKRPVISLLTDFGASDHYVGAMKGVMLGICPGVQFVDISHEITPYAITEAAYTLAQAWQCFPEGTIHLVVVDPGVGGSRRPILAEVGARMFVAPDNGVLTMVFDVLPKHRVREIKSSRYFRNPVSNTFHGRDIFAPVAAHLASGVPARKFGSVIEDYVRLSIAGPLHSGPDRWTGSVLKVDRFGNLITNFNSEEWKRLTTSAFHMKAGTHSTSLVASSYSEVAPGELFLITGSAGYLEISVNQGSASEVTGCTSGSQLELVLVSQERTR